MKAYEERDAPSAPDVDYEHWINFSDILTIIGTGDWYPICSNSEDSHTVRIKFGPGNSDSLRDRQYALRKIAEEVPELEYNP